MSTRSQIVVKDEHNELWFYRHSDGYPKGAMPTLLKFIKWVREGKIRNNVEQASGWLIMIGAEEYFQQNKQLSKDLGKSMGNSITDPNDNSFSGWKVGAYEPSVPERHGDIEYIYFIDLIEESIKGYRVGDERDPVIVSKPNKLQMINDDGVLVDIEESDLE